MSGRLRRRAGFTLVEILVALAIVGMMLLALNTFVFSMGELWGRHTERHLFDEHVNAVTRYLQQTLDDATLPPAARANAKPVAPALVAPANGMQDQLITFDLLSGSRFFNWPGRALPEVTCSLQVRPNDGLYILWHSRLETTYATTPPRETKVSPYVTAMAYDYFDDSSKRWSTQTLLQNGPDGNPMAPQRLRFTFTYGKMVRQTIVIVPIAEQGLPDF